MKRLRSGGRNTEKSTRCTTGRTHYVKKETHSALSEAANRHWQRDVECGTELSFKAGARWLARRLKQIDNSINGYVTGYMQDRLNEALNGRARSARGKKRG